MDTLFFIISKLVWMALRPDTWLVLGLAAGLLLLVFGRAYLAGWILSATLAFTVIMAIFPVGEALIYPLEIQFPANPVLNQVDGIIVLGGAEDARLTRKWSQVQFNGSSERFSKALTLALQHPNAIVIFTGGSGSLRNVMGTEFSGSTVAEKYFLENGISTDRLRLEGNSRNTAENARFSYDLMQPQRGETWLLVTSAFHLPRAMSSFQRAGWEGLVPYPVDYYAGNFGDGIGWNLVKNLNILNFAVREYVGVLAYNLTGR